MSSKTKTVKASSEEVLDITIAVELLEFSTMHCSSTPGILAYLLTDCASLVTSDF